MVERRNCVAHGGPPRSPSSPRAPTPVSARAAYAPRRIAAFVLLLVAAMTAFPGSGVDAFADSGDVGELLRRAEAGDARAAFALGMRYARPDDSSRDDVEAVRWLRRAAEQGLAEAQYNLGIMYVQGRGVPVDPAQAADWYRQAAEQGLAGAQYNLGSQYAVGEGVPRDEQRAAMWFERAALQNVPEAAYNLGVLYDIGRGVAPDAATAVQWYERAAAQGYHPAASRLAALRAANPKLAAKPAAAPAGTVSETPPVASTQADPAPLQTPGPAPAPPGVSPATSTSEPAAVAQLSSPSPNTRSASPWLAALAPDHYTLQVLSHTNEESVRRYMSENFEDGEAGYFAFELDGKIWYTVVYGDYPSHSQASAAGADLAGRLRGPAPWVRKVAIIQAAAIR